ncbi:MAG: alpha/beta hydrolase [Candidatus Saccharibacteria bacterium]
MKQQVLVIHGGNTFGKYKDFLDDLKNKKIDLERLKYRLDWKDTLADDLGDMFEVLTPRMPNGTNAKYIEWIIYFENIILSLDNNLILIGHSLGGVFLAKYLSQNTLSKKINAVILVAAPFKDLSSEKIGGFKVPKSLSILNKQPKNLLLIQSLDDPVVEPSHVDMYKKELTNAKTMIFKDRGHFQIEHFPELVRYIKNL